MSNYILRGAHRGPEGEIGETLHEHVIQAEDTAQAIAAAKAFDFSELGHTDLNTMYLCNPDGHVVWSLRQIDRVS